MPRRLLLAALLFFTLDPVLTQADTHILTFGGGPTPDYNQISLEKNIQYFQHVLADLGLAQIPHDIYFADGGSPHQIVQYEAPEDPAQTLTVDLAYLLDDVDFDERYEPVSLPHLQGPSTPTALTAWFNTTGKSLHADDHLLFYFTGHGGDDRFHQNTTMEMWNSPPVKVHDLIRNLDTLDPAVDVTLIMVQCHAGGFANVIYTDGDPKKGFSNHPRCGFFATTAPRLAAGCTPEMNEDDYQDFSTHFFAALSGKTRTGKPVQKPDYDHKGFTSFTDAFTYVLLNDDTIDIPMTTSDQLLRDFSHYRTSEETTDLLESNARYSDILAAANPAQQAALDGLSTQLALTGDDRIAKARALAADLEQQRNVLARAFRRNMRTFNNARTRLRTALIRQYPELAGHWHPDDIALIATQHDAILAFLKSQPDYKTYQDASKKRDDLDDQDDALERKWVVTQRFLERARTVILAANLPKLVQPDVVQVYNDLIARENQTIKK